MYIKTGGAGGAPYPLWYLFGIKNAQQNYTTNTIYTYMYIYIYTLNLVIRVGPTRRF